MWPISVIAVLGHFDGLNKLLKNEVCQNDSFYDRQFYNITEGLFFYPEKSAEEVIACDKDIFPDLDVTFKRNAYIVPNGSNILSNLCRKNGQLFRLNAFMLFLGTKRSKQLPLS